MSSRQTIIIAHHLILTGYAHWLSNDPRGSGSTVTACEPLRQLGPIHFGRKEVQPPREELRKFYREAVPMLPFPPLWWDAMAREILAQSFAATAARERYTIWACAALSNHAHLVVRRHKHDGKTIWRRLADDARTALRGIQGVDPLHPIWAERPYSVFLHTPAEVRQRIAYVNGNPAKEGLPAQDWDFVKEYDGWPLQKHWG